MIRQEGKPLTIFLVILYLVGIAGLVIILLYPIPGAIQFRFYDEKSGDPVTAPITIHDIQSGTNYLIEPNSQGNFLLEGLSQGYRKFSFKSDDYQQVQKEIEVISANTVEVDIPLTPNFVHFKADFFDSVTNQRIALPIKVVKQPENKTYEGPGAIEIPKLKLGDYVLKISSYGHYYDKNHSISISTIQDYYEKVYLTPKVSRGARFVLEWSVSPLDLDSHLLVPPRTRTIDHVFFSSLGNKTKHPYANLDLDDTSSYGPETMTVYKPLSGIYKYAVHNYSQTPSITVSEAKVDIYDKTGIVRTFTVPVTGDGLWWLVCEFTFDAQGAINIDEINTITDDGWRTEKQKQ